MNTFNGMRVILNDTLTKNILEEVNRTFFERLFSFSPFVKTKKVVKTIPDDQIIINQATKVMVMHPIIWGRMKHEIDNERLEDISNKPYWLRS